MRGLRKAQAYSVGAVVGDALVTHDALHLRLVLLHAELGLFLLDILHDFTDAALALALELPAARELDAAPPARLLRGLTRTLNDVDVGDRELVALLDGAVRDELELGRAGGEGRAGGGVAGVGELQNAEREVRGGECGYGRGLT